MSEIVVEFKADSSNLNQSIDAAIKKIKDISSSGLQSAEEYNNAVQKIGTELKNTFGGNLVGELNKQIKAAEVNIADIDTVIKSLNVSLSQTTNPARIDELNAAIGRQEEAILSEQEKAEALYRILDSAMKSAKEATDATTKAVNDTNKALAETSNGDNIFDKVITQSKETVSKLGFMEEAISTLPMPLQLVGKAFLTVAKGATVLTAVPIIAVIAAVVLAFKALSAWLNSTVEGQKAATSASAKFQAILTVLKNLLVAVGGAMYKAFSKVAEWIGAAVGAVVKFTNSLGVLANFIPGLNLVKLFSDAATAFDALTSEMREDLPEAYKNLKSITEVLEKINADELQLKIDKGEWKKQEAELNRDINTLRNKISEGVDASQQLADVNASISLIEQRYDKELEFAKRELELAQANDAINDNNIEDNVRIAELTAAVTQKEADKQAEIMRMVRQRVSFEQQIAREAYQRRKELSNLTLSMEKEYLSIKAESLDKTLEAIELERKTQIQSLQDQEDAWRQNQKRMVKDANGVDVEQSYITNEQKQYLAQKREQITVVFNDRANKASADYAYNVYKTYVDGIIDLEKQKLNAQEDSLGKSLALIDDEARTRRKAIEEQKNEWLLKQGGIRNADGSVSGGRLEAEQQALLSEQAAWIDADTQKKKQDALVKAYQSTQNKLLNLAKRYQSDISTLQIEGANNGIDTAYSQLMAENKINLDALSAIEEDERLSEQLDSFITSLGFLTTNALTEKITQIENQIKAEGKITNAKQAEEVMMLRAQLQSLKNISKEAQKNVKDAIRKMSTKKPVEVAQDLADRLSNCSSGFYDIAELSDSTFGEMAKVMGDITGATSSVINAVLSVTQTACQGMSLSAVMAAESIKTVEKASVILAIIGAVIQAAMAIAKLFKDDDGHLTEYKNEIAELNKEIQQMLIDADLKNNRDTIFGANTFTNFIDSAQDAKKYLSAFTEDLAQAGDVTATWSFSLKNGFHITRTSIREAGLAANQSLSDIQAFAKGLESVKIQTKHSTWFRSAEYATLGSMGLDLVGETDQQTMENIKAFADTDVFNKLSEEQKDAVNKMIQDWDAYQEALDQTTEALSSWFDGMADAWGDAIVQAFEDGTDAAQAFSNEVGDILRDFAKDLMQSIYITQIMEDAQKEIKTLLQDDTYSQLTSEGQAKAIGNIAIQTADKMKSKLSEAQEFYAAWDDALSQAGYLSSAEANANTLSGAISGASQESIDLLSGYCNAVRIQQVESIDLLREQLILMSSINLNTASVASYTKRIYDNIDMATGTDSLRANGL